MLKLKFEIMFSINFLKYSYKQFLQYAFQAFGVLYFIIKLCERFFPGIQPSTQQSYFGIIFFGLATVYAIFKICPKISEYYKFKGTDVKLGFSIQDIFKISGNKVISTNAKFEMKTREDGGVIDSNSLQGKFRHKYHQKVEHLETEIKKSLSNEKIQNSKIGDIIKIELGSYIIYLVALTNLNDKGIVTDSNFKNLQKCLANLWRYVGDSANYGHVVMPLIGTGSARINKKRIDIAKEIIRSFIPAISEKKLCEKLTICISPSDYRKHSINIDELRKFIKCSCQFTEFADNSEKPTGTALKNI